MESNQNLFFWAGFGGSPSGRYIQHFCPDVSWTPSKEFALRLRRGTLAEPQVTSGLARLPGFIGVEALPVTTVFQSRSKPTTPEHLQTTNPSNKFVLPQGGMGGVCVCFC